MSACGRGTFDVGNETDRLAMKIDIRNALTVNNCSAALELSTQLYNSSYSDNEVRMLYASAHACNVGINLYTLIDQITTSDFSSADQIFKSLVRLFPSKIATDTRLQSGFYAQDALQSILKPGVVVGSADRIAVDAANPGSVLLRDRTDDANMYLVFIAMSEVGTNLNRYGFNASDDPATFNYAQQVALPFQSEGTVSADASGSGCGLASALLNMFDGIHSIITQVSGNTSTSLNQILTTLESGATLAGKTACLGIPYTAAQCDAAIARLRYRRACFEQTPSPESATAAGINAAVDAGWN